MKKVNGFGVRGASFAGGSFPDATFRERGFFPESSLPQTSLVKGEIQFTLDFPLLLISLRCKTCLLRGIMVLSVNERTFKQEVLESPVPVLVNFGAPWCGLCRIIQPLLLQFHSKNSDRIKLVAVNADENFKLANTYRLTSLPTLILIENGNIRQRLEGFEKKEELHLALEAIKTNYADNCINSAANSDWQRRYA